MAKKGNDTVTTLVDTVDLVRYCNDKIPLSIEHRPMYALNQAVLLRIVDEQGFPSLHRYGDTRLWPIGDREKIRKALDRVMMSDIRSRAKSNTALRVTA